MRIGNSKLHLKRIAATVLILISARKDQVYYFARYFDTFSCPGFGCPNPGLEKLLGKLGLGKIGGGKGGKFDGGGGC